MTKKDDEGGGVLDGLDERIRENYLTHAAAEFDRRGKNPVTRSAAHEVSAAIRAILSPPANTRPDKLAEDERYVGALTNFLVEKLKRTTPEHAGHQRAVMSEMVMSRVRKIAHTEALEVLRLIDDLAAGKDTKNKEEHQKERREHHHHNKTRRPHDE